MCIRDRLLVAGASYVTVDGPLETTREHDAPPSQHILDMVEASARAEGMKVAKLRRPAQFK